MNRCHHGRTHSETSEMHGGWGFNSYWAPGLPNKPDPAVVNNLADAQLIAQPVFIPFALPEIGIGGPEMWWLNPVVKRATISFILATAAPATSHAAGTGRASGLGDGGDMQGMQNGWSLTRGKDIDWKHSDFQAVAFPYVYKLFDKMK